MRTLCAAMLTFQALVLALAIPVATGVDDVDGSTAGWVFGGLAVLCLLTAGMLRSPAGYALGWGLQAATIATGALVPAMYGVGVLFLALWVSAVHWGRKADAARAAWNVRIAAAKAAKDSGSGVQGPGAATSDGDVAPAR
jgi:hypothetical protein